MWIFLQRWIESRRRRKEEKVYDMVIAVETRKAAVIDWHLVQKCKYCERPLMVECDFCPHCGVNLKEKHTTAQVKLVNVMPAPQLSVPQTVTGVIKTYHIPGERPINTLARLGRNKNVRR